MAIREKEVDGKKVYEVSMGIRSKVRSTIKVQRLKKNIPTLREAQQIEKEMIRECSAEVARLEGSGIPWIDLLDQYELEHRKLLAEADPVFSRKMQKNILMEQIATLRRFTEPWKKINCQDLGPGDARRIFRQMELDGYSRSRMRAVKSAINTVFKWGLEEGIIVGIHHSPTQYVQLAKVKDEAPPQILTLSEIHQLVEAAREAEHPWYPIWFTALNTGMRSGELYALQWSDVDFEGKLITVSKSYNNRMKLTKSTKAGYWRKVPINRDLEKLLLELRAKARFDENGYVLPRVSRWKNGESAKYLRDFCEQIGIRSVNFHALRACFATHLLSAGVSSPTVKKICGWTEEKVMGRYIRLAGVDIAGATEHLSFRPPEALDTARKVVNLREVRITKNPEDN